jgi:hypothetical protein
MKDTIIIKDEFLTPTECAGCIQFYEALKDQTFYYDDNNTRPLKLNTMEEYFENINERLQDLIRTVDPREEFYFSNHEIVKWVPGCEMGYHLDHHYDKWSAIIYLNDDFFGGKTIFGNGMTVPAKTGTIVLFNGGQMQHGVQEVLNGERYTMAYWIRYYKYIDECTE